MSDAAVQYAPTGDHGVIPKGWRILIRPRKAEAKTRGGILLAEDARKATEVLTQVGEVIAMGGDCYRADEFRGERWCDVGDHIMYSRHVGQAVEVRHNDGSSEYLRLLNDNEVLARVDHPDRIRGYAD